MKSIRFRYNKYPPSVLYIMVIFAVALGFLVYYVILVFLGIDKGPEYVPAYFSKHTNHAIYMIFGLIPICMMLPAWIAAKLWGSRDEVAQLKLYKNYAVLYFRNEELRIEKGNLKIKVPEPHPHWYTAYILKAPGRRIVLVTSVKEDKETVRARLSLDMAMQELSAYEN